MKKILILILFLCYQECFSQDYRPFINEGKQWNYYYACPNGPCSFYEIKVNYIVKGDTLIDAVSYKKVYGYITDWYEGSWPGHKTVYLAAIIREDTINKKVFMYYGLENQSSYSFYNTEQVLFDFSLGVGDYLERVYFSSPPELRPLQITKIDSVELQNGEKVVKYYSNNVPLQIESIGSELILFEYQWISKTLETIINCVSEYQEPIYGDHCSGLTEIKKQETESSLFKVYPNQINQTIYIESNISKSKFILYDIMGKSVIETNIYYGLNTVNCANISCGLYIYRIHSEFNEKKGLIQKIN